MIVPYLFTTINKSNKQFVENVISINLNFNEIVYLIIKLKHDEYMKYFMPSHSLFTYLILTCCII